MVVSAGNSSFCIAANLVISWKTRISQQTVPVPLLCVLSCTYDDSGAYIKLCEPMMMNMENPCRVIRQISEKDSVQYRKE